MEPVRPLVDSFLADWIAKQPLKREWFFEQRNGNARLMAPLAEKLTETGPMWARAVAPVAEWVSQTIWTQHKKPSGEQTLPTRLTHRRRTEGRGMEFILKTAPAPPPPKVCLGCGVTTQEGQLCQTCGRRVSKEKLIGLARQGRVVAQTPQSQKKRSETQRRHQAAKRQWQKSGASSGDCEKYDRAIQPHLASVPIARIAATLGVCEPYAADIRSGRRRPHPRHRLALAELVGGQPV